MKKKLYLLLAADESESGDTSENGCGTHGFLPSQGLLSWV